MVLPLTATSVVNARFGTLLAGGETAIFPQVRFGPVEWGLMAALPVLTAVIAMVTARRTVLRSLTDLS